MFRIYILFIYNFNCELKCRFIGAEQLRIDSIRRFNTIRENDFLAKGLK